MTHSQQSQTEEYAYYTAVFSLGCITLRILSVRCMQSFVVYNMKYRKLILCIYNSKMTLDLLCMTHFEFRPLTSRSMFVVGQYYCQSDGNEFHYCTVAWYLKFPEVSCKVWAPREVCAIT